MRFLLLGGYGYTGKLLARRLLEESAVEIILAGRHADRAREYAEQLNAEFGGQRISSCRVDAASRDDLLRALTGTNFLLVAAPATRYAETVIRAALDAEVDYLDIQLDANKLALLKSLAPEIERAGRCFITEAGFHPGLPAAMVRYAATQMDTIDTAVLGGYLNMGRALPYSEAVDELMEAFRHYEGQVYEEGGWTKTSAYKTRKIDFSGEIGVRNCFSMFFEELRELPKLIPSLRELGFYMSGINWMVDWVITPLVMAGLQIPSARLSRRLGKITWWGMQNFSRPPYLVALQVEAAGERAGKPVKLVCRLAHPDGYEFTAIPVVACLRQYLDGTARRPGLWLMGHLVEPERLFEDMERMGVQVALETILRKRDR